jgi:L-threonylcarbamoyladenylate synthase
MQYISLQEDGAEAALRVAVPVLGNGGIVAFPTETFYAFGVRYDSIEALARLYALKGRPERKAVGLIVGDTGMLDMLAARVDPLAQRLMEKYWPGPLTLLFEAREGLLPEVVSEGRVAVRQPGGGFALALAREAEFPITATSANPSGAEPPRDAQSVVGYFPEGLDLVIDGAETPGGLPSTLVDTTGEGPRILREGACKLSAEDLLI